MYSKFSQVILCLMYAVEVLFYMYYRLRNIILINSIILFLFINRRILLCHLQNIKRATKARRNKQADRIKYQTQRFRETCPPSSTFITLLILAGFRNSWHYLQTAFDQFDHGMSISINPDSYHRSTLAGVHIFTLLIGYLTFFDYVQTIVVGILVPIFTRGILYFDPNLLRFKNLNI